jgi:hypothetical protein
MMEAGEIFKIANAFASIGWLLMLVLYSFDKMAQWLIGGIVILLCIAYVIIIVPGLSKMPADSFSTIEGVMALFQSKEAVLAGWIHYLAFDLLTGITIAMSAKSYGINRFVMLPFWLFTFMLGPLGFLLYYTFLTIKSKQFLPRMIRL